MPRSQQWLARLIELEGIADARIADAFRRIDRADFVPPGRRRGAYEDRPVALPDGQTTSQPSLIARMIAAADVGGDDRVLEVGTGYGFQTALLACLASEVTSIERLPLLAAAARGNLTAAAIDNAEVRIGDGRDGCPERAPFDAVIVSAAAPEIPGPLVAQLVDGGRLVIPLRRPGSDDVMAFVKDSGALGRGRLIAPARFVPLLGPADETDSDEMEEL